MRVRMASSFCAAFRAWPKWPEPPTYTKAGSAAKANARIG